MKQSIGSLIYEGSLFSAIGGGKNHLCGLASALARRQLPVTVITPKRLGDLSLESSVEHVRLHARGPLPIRLVDYELSKIIRLWRTRRNADSTLLLTRLSTLGIATGFASILGYKVVVEVNGPLSIEVRNRVPYLGGVLGYICEAMEKIQLRSAQHVVCVSGSLKGYVFSLSPNSDILVLPNGATSPSSDNTVARESISSNQETLKNRSTQVCYLGAVTAWYDLEMLEQAVDRLGSDAHLHIIGDGPGLSQLASTEGKHRTLWGWLNTQDSNQVLKRCSIGVIPANPLSKSAALRSPLKLYHYLSAGLVVVVADIIEIEPELSPYVVTYRAGDADDLVAALKNAGNKTKRIAPSHLWSWDSRAEVLSKWLELLNGPGSE